MTPEQEQQFTLFGCIPRCLIELAARIGRQISKQEFCERFEQFFHNTNTQYGLLNPDYIPEISRALSLPSVRGQQEVPTKLGWVEDYDKVRLLHQGGVHILIASQINLMPGATDIVRHCSVLHGIDDQTFTLWTPSQDGKDYVLPPLSRQDWQTKQCRGMVLV